MPDRKRRPVLSTRHAFALAFDLAVRRDAFHSLVVPILARAPWVLTLALLPPLETLEGPSPGLGLACVALLGDFVTLLVLGAMLRLRARSVFDAPAEARPAPVGECYARGLRRIPWLLVTEVVRNVTLGVAASFSILPTAFLTMSPEAFFEDLPSNLLLIVAAVALLVPTLFLDFRLAVATESVVLDEHDLAGAFQRSFRMMAGRLVRWLEMVLASGALILALVLFVTVLSVLMPWLPDDGQVALFWMLVIAATPIVQYAWTFFYLQLVEVEEPAM